MSGSTTTQLKDFGTLATAITAVNANISDTGITLSSYTPTNVARACPAVQANVWLANEKLPPTPNATLCENMVASSSCVSTLTDATKIGALFGTVCGLDATACKGITSNATSGVYGEFVMCNETQQLTNALNTYYANQKKASTACDFSGAAKVVTPSQTQISAPSTGSSSGSGSSVSSNSTGTSNGGSTTGAGSSSSGTSSGGSTASTATTGSGTKANSNSTQSSGTGTSNGVGRVTIGGNAGWAGVLLTAVGAFALVL